MKHAVYELEKGLIDADLGAGLIKKRIAKNGQGKSGGYRVLVAFKNHDRSVFIFGFSKNDRENLDPEENKIYKKVAKMYFDIPMDSLETMCIKGLLTEVIYEKE